MPTETEQQVRDLALVATRLYVVVLPAAVGVLFISIPAFDGWGRAIGASVLIALAALLAGGVVGFLFGIPKSTVPPPAQPGARDNDAPPTPRGAFQIPGLRRNTNIEEISDWLTKIIVGLGIYELKEIPTHLHSLAYFLAQAYGDKASYPYGVLGVVIAILFACAGFLIGYLLTVLFMPGALQRADSAHRRHEELEQDATVARQLENMVGAAGQAVPENIRQQVLSLAARYERERSSRLPGPERTNAMEEVTRDVRKLGLAAYAMLPELKSSESPGQRLAAIAFLCIRPDAASLEWLAERIVFEVPFLKYQAAVALDRAASEPAITSLDALKAAIAKGRKHLEDERQTTTDEYRMLLSAEKKAAART